MEWASNWAITSVSVVELKVQFQSLTDEEKDTKKQEMKLMMEELLPLSVEEKTQKLREFVNSL